MSLRTHLKYACLPPAALAFSLLAVGEASRGHAQTSTSPGSTTATLAPSCSSGTGQVWPETAQISLSDLGQQDLSVVYATAATYVAEFYPLWFTAYQAQQINGLVGPEQVTPLYNVVVAINIDTVYASAFLDLSQGPMVLTIPPTPGKYSILTLDPFGDIYKTTLQPSTAGSVYALVGPSGFAGTLPQGVTPVAMPFNAMTLIFRADRFSPPPAQDQTDQANAFRQQLRLQPLANYVADPTGGATAIVPEKNFAFPFKLTADALVAQTPITFLRLLQQAVASSRTPPLTPDQQALSQRFDELFGAGLMQRDQFSGGAQFAHDLIVDRYLKHTGPTNWVHFCNIGNWDGGKQGIERSAITEFCQYCNDISAAAYYHAFTDGAGRQLTGMDPKGYVLTFPKNKLPQYTRFWSLTAYTPETVELIPNPAGKYAVASYTKDLTYNLDGSLSIYLSTTLPRGVPPANWLPVSPGQFNVMLRIYGPVGDVGEDAGSYTPPAIQRQ